jgi:hypothetical protein
MKHNPKNKLPGTREAWVLKKEKLGLILRFPKQRFAQKPPGTLRGGRFG